MTQATPIVLFSIRRRGASSVSVPNLKRIGQFVQMLSRGSRNYEIRSYDPGHAHLWVVLWSQRREAPSCMSVPNLKRIALFVQKLLGGPKFRHTADPLQFNQLDMVTTCTYRPSLVKIDAHNFELPWQQTPPTHPPVANAHPQTGPITIHCAPAS